jgi:membrane glycosyltransferase
MTPVTKTARCAGGGVWIAYDLPGSDEEMPPNQIEELKRDRRWCQGNLINSRLFFAHGLHPAHRAVFVTGVMAYASAPLWFAFLVLSTAVLAVHTLVAPTYFTAPRQLFPLWPQWHPEWAIELFAATATMLFLPKVLGVACAMAAQPQAFGGRLKLAASALIEMAFSALLAPIRMLFHTQFVFTSLLGLNVSWKSPPRGDNETGWGEALRRHGVHTLIGISWAAFVYRLNPEYLWWLLPVAGALALSIPLSVFSSRVALGRAARERRLFLIPEETAPPTVLRRMQRYLRRAPLLPRFVDAVVDPLDNALACAAEATRAHRSESAAQHHRWLIERTLELGPELLRPQDANALLGDGRALAALHAAVWTRAEIAPEWARLRLALPHAPPRGAANHVRREHLAARLRALIAQHRSTPPARRSA